MSKNDEIIKVRDLNSRNGTNGYFPTRKAFSRGGGYETNIGTARFTPDAGYLVVDAAVEMLQSLSKQYAKE